MTDGRTFARYFFHDLLNRRGEKVTKSLNEKSEYISLRILMQPKFNSDAVKINFECSENYFLFNKSGCPVKQSNHHYRLQAHIDYSASSKSSSTPLSFCQLNVF